MNALMAGWDALTNQTTRLLRVDRTGRAAACAQGLCTIYQLGNTSAGAYAAGQLVGAPNANNAANYGPVGLGDNYVNAPYLTGNPGYSDELILDSLTLMDPAAQAAALDILFFSDDPTVAGGSTLADKAAFDWGTGSDQLLLGKVSLSPADYSTINLRSVATLNNLGLGLRADAGKVWWYVVAQQAVTFGANKKLALTLSIRRG
jgi:hypothetical protein